MTARTTGGGRERVRDDLRALEAKERTQQDRDLDVVRRVVARLDAQAQRAADTRA